MSKIESLKKGSLGLVSLVGASCVGYFVYETAPIMIAELYKNFETAQRLTEKGMYLTGITAGIAGEVVLAGVSVGLFYKGTKYAIEFIKGSDEVIEKSKTRKQSLRGGLENGRTWV